MQHRTLGSLDVSAIGFGAMALVPGLYGEVDDAAGVATIRHALDAGVTLIDTSDADGIDGGNERLVGRAIRGRRDEVVIATKFGFTDPGSPTAHRVEGSYANEIWSDARPEVVRPRAEASLRRLGIDVIDLYLVHFPDPGVPIEDTIGAMAELVGDGLVRAIGIANGTADDLRRAHAIHPIAAVQNEFSLWTRDPERALLPATRELGVGFMAWGPLGSGMLTGALRELGANDFRNNHPRFQGDNLRRNADRFAPLRDVAAAAGLEPAQLALAWLLAQGEQIVPIPGTRAAAHLDSNIAAVAASLSGEVLARIEAVAPAGAAIGASLLGSAEADR